MAASITAPAVRARKVRTGADPLVMVTAYDAPGARMADEAGVDLILVGDSLAMVVLGYDDTLQVTIDDMAHHVAAVARAKPRPLVVGDLPWLSYHVSVEDTVRNAATLVRAGAQAVKLEGGRKRVPMVEAHRRRRDPGDGPPRAHAAVGARDGRLQGAGQGARRRARARRRRQGARGGRLLRDRARRRARRGRTHGHRRGRRCRPSASAPGPHCDGQVLVFHDLLGLEDRIIPKFVRRYADLKADRGRGAQRVRGRRAHRDGSRPTKRATTSPTTSASP